MCLLHAYKKTNTPTIIDMFVLVLVDYFKVDFEAFEVETGACKGKFGLHHSMIGFSTIVHFKYNSDFAFFKHKLSIINVRKSCCWGYSCVSVEIVYSFADRFEFQIN